jgi:hypothetical protein
MSTPCSLDDYQASFSKTVRGLGTPLRSCVEAPPNAAQCSLQAPASPDLRHDQPKRNVESVRTRWYAATSPYFLPEQLLRRYARQRSHRPQPGHVVRGVTVGLRQSMYILKLCCGDGAGSQLPVRVGCICGFVCAHMPSVWKLPNPHLSGAACSCSLLATRALIRRTKCHCCNSAPC